MLPNVAACIGTACRERDYWIDEARLNHLRRQGVKYAEIQLYTGDMYVQSTAGSHAMMWQ